MSAQEDMIKAIADGFCEIAHGDVRGPGGLEYLAMAIGEGTTSGSNLGRNLADSVHDGLIEVSNSIDRLAAAIEALAPERKL